MKILVYLCLIAARERRNQTGPKGPSGIYLIESQVFSYIITKHLFILNYLKWIPKRISTLRTKEREALSTIQMSQNRHFIVQNRLNRLKPSKTVIYRPKPFKMAKNRPKPFKRVKNRPKPPQTVQNDPKCPKTAPNRPKGSKRVKNRHFIDKLAKKV